MQKRPCVLIEDDRAFSDLLVATASAQGLAIEAFASLAEMGSIGRLGDYEVAVVDYGLGELNGLEIAEYVPSFFGGMPVVLISGSPHAPRSADQWPKSIVEFIDKADGMGRIIEAVGRARRSCSVAPAARH